MQKKQVFVETALLGQGLQTISAEEMLTAWQKALGESANQVQCVWLANGEFCSGTLAQFLPYRQQKQMLRLGVQQLAAAKQQAQSGFLTAGAVMHLWRAEEKAIVVTAGMGGIRGQQISSDLPEVCQKRTFLIATAPKDMLDYPQTFAYYQQHGVAVYGYRQPLCDGFVFQQTAIPLAGCYQGENLKELKEKDCYLLLQAIPREQRFQNQEWLEKAVAIGELAAQQGREFHPAVNQSLNEQSQGKNAKLQLHSLLNNIKIALEINQMI